MEKSFKQIINSLNSFATAHKGIASFSCNIPQKNIAKSSLYPMLFVTFGNAVFENGQIRLSLECNFLDIPSKESNYVQELSDMGKIVEDFITYFNKNEEEHGFYFTDTSTASPISYAFEDIVIGFKIPVEVQIKSSQNEYDIPL